MGVPDIDRKAWAEKITALIDQETSGNKSAFARRIGVQSVKTIDRWLAQSVAVSEESVRQVARALRLPVADLLTEVGFIKPDEWPSSEAQKLIESDEEAIRTIERADAPPSLKRQLLDHLLQQRAEHERQRLAEIRRMLEIAEQQRGRAG